MKISSAEFAGLANDVYKSSPKGSKMYRWSRQNFLGDSTNGFFAAAFLSPRTRQMVVAYRGTQFESRVDWENNLRNTAGLTNWNSQLNQALSYYEAVKHLYGPNNTAVCGHSLGGFLASMVSLKLGVLGVAFNAAPLGVSGVPSLVKSLVRDSRPRLVNFRLAGDIVSGLSPYNIGSVIELEPLSNMQLLAIGDWDPLDITNHPMVRMEQTILRHKNFDLSPEEWAGI